MRLTAGTHLGPYEILSAIGAGGMGEVYRARDTRLDRPVAVKILSAEIASSSEARQRFEREARTISQLSHPHICAVYDVGQHEGTEYLVMELLEGETLAGRIATGPLPIALAASYAIDIAEALEAAHRHGVVHRDLKPANVMIATAGLKLLDFGLAKAASATPAAATTAVDTAAVAPDVTGVATIAGTVQYMAPEQLEGRPADARTDIFALGVVIYEMVTGRRPFAGGSPLALTSAILHAEPAPMSAPGGAIPPAVQRLVQVCLAKDPHDRWQSAHDIALQLSSLHDAAGVATSPQPSASSRSRLGSAWPWMVTAAALALTLALAMRAPTATPASPVRFQVAAPAGGRFPDTVETVPFAVSPDGLQLAMVVIEADGRSRVWIRAFGSIDMRPLAGTEGAEGVFWSPDSRALGFFAGSKLKRVDVGGGAVVPLCDVREGIGQTGTWGPDGQILFAPVDGSAILRTSTGGEAAVVERAPEGDAARIRWPSFLRDGRYLYAAHSKSGSWTQMLAARGQPPRAIGAMASVTQYVEPGYLVFAREGTLLGQRFDAASGRVSGEPFSIANPVRYFASTGWSPFSVSDRGTLAYQAHGGVAKIVSYDRSGRELGTVGTPGEDGRVHLSADGKTAMLDRVRSGLGTIDVWSIDLARGVETRLTSDPGTEAAPVAVPGTHTVVFASTKRDGQPNVVRRDLDSGLEEYLMPPASMQMVEDVSPDGRVVLFSQRSADGNFDLWTIPTAGSQVPSIFLKSVTDQQSARFSPDGRFVAFMSNESGWPDIYVVPFGSRAVATRVSTGGGRAPRWGRDSHELFFLSADRQLMAVPVRTDSTLHLGQPAPLTAVSAARRWSTFDVAPDGQTFVAIVPETLAGEQPLTVVLNWTPGVPE